MKTGIGHVRMVEVQCPHCGEYISCKQTGSHLLNQDSGYRAGEVVECDGCGASFKVPALVAAL